MGRRIDKEELLALKDEIEESKKKESELKGELKLIKRQLETEFGFTTIEEINKETKKLKKEVDDLESKIQKGIKQIKKLLKDES